jgi:predicted DNA-binding transcriptional regulator AlpA
VTSHRIKLGTVEASEHIGVARSTLSKWRMRGEGPKFHRRGPRLIYYYQDEIDAWLAACDRDH